MGQYKEQLTKWKEDVEAWEADMSKLNPFEIKTNCMQFCYTVSCQLI